MCGIIGIFPREGSVQADELLEGLRRLEYRGYDSWGIGLRRENGSFFIHRETGRLGRVHLTAEGRVGIGHTRWATHGRVSRKNAHPQASRLDGLIGVHNGIIENTREIESLLAERGVHEWVSETDTERALTLLDAYMQGMDWEDALRAFAMQARGSFAMLILTHTDVFFLVRGSPLLLGRGERGIVAASDVTAFPDWVVEFTPLPEGTGGRILVEEGSVRMIRLDKDEPLHPRWEARPVDAGLPPLGEYPYYTLKEIMEQPARLREAWQYWEHDARVREAERMLSSAERILVIASGTSLHAGMVFQRWQALREREVMVIDAADDLLQKPFLREENLLIAISQSGETADVLEAVRRARARNMRVLALVNRPFSTLAREASLTLSLHAGVEVSVVATKSYTAQLLLLARLSSIPLPDGFFETLGGLVEQVWGDVQRLAHAMREAHDVFLIARGLDVPTAFEGALKIKEISYAHAEAFQSGTLKHGSLALIHPGTWTIGIVTRREDHAGLMANLAEVSARGGRTVLVSPWEGEADVHIRIPDLGMLGVISSIIPLQLLAYELTVLRGLNPDRPRNLAKSVTVK